MAQVPANLDFTEPLLIVGGEIVDCRVEQSIHRIAECYARFLEVVEEGIQIAECDFWNRDLSLRFDRNPMFYLLCFNEGFNQKKAAWDVGYLWALKRCYILSGIGSSMNAQATNRESKRISAKRRTFGNLQYFHWASRAYLASRQVVIVFPRNAWERKLFDLYKPDYAAANEAIMCSRRETEWRLKRQKRYER